MTSFERIDFNVVGKWDYSSGKQFPYGDTTTYIKAGVFLGICKTVEDWGCGTAYAKQFMKGTYIGIDGSKGPHADKVADLREYRSSPEGILLRHVLDHNLDWRKILSNAIASFQKRLCIVIFTPFSKDTRVLCSTNGIPDISFRKEEITEALQGLKYTEEPLSTNSQYGVEHVFYVERN